MSGHSKFANIRAKKEKNDAAKGKAFTVIGREIAVFCRVPLSGKLRTQSRQIVKPLQHPLPGAVGAALAAVKPLIQVGLIRVAFGADPPERLFKPAFVFRCAERTVLLRVPLRQNLPIT